jgi:hypothetical protein
MGHGAPEQDEEIDERGGHQRGNAEDPARGERLHIDEFQEALATVGEEARQPGSNERVGHEAEREGDQGRPDMAPRGLEQEHNDDDPDHHVARGRIVHHGHAAGQSVILDDVVAAAGEGPQRAGPVQPTMRAAPAELLRLGGGLGNRRGEKAKGDREGHVDRKLNHQIEEARVGRVKLEEGPGDPEGDAR